MFNLSSIKVRGFQVGDGLKDLLGFITENGLSMGANFCEVRYFEERSSSISVKNGVAKALGAGILRGVGVRVIVDGR